MKKLLLTFTICISIFKVPNTEANNDYTAISNYLLRSLKEAIHDADKDMLEILIVQQKVTQTKSIISDKISKNSKMIELETFINKHAPTKNIESCKKEKEEDVETLTTELTDIVTHAVQSEMNADNSNLMSIRQHLLTIKQNIENNLSGEIKICKDIPDKCRLSKEYTNVLFESKKIIDEKKYSIPTIIDTTIVKLDPIITKDVTKDIYNPIFQCINKLL